MDIARKLNRLARSLRRGGWGVADTGEEVADDIYDLFTKAAADADRLRTQYLKSTIDQLQTTLKGISVTARVSIEYPEAANIWSEGTNKSPMRVQIAVPKDTDTSAVIEHLVDFGLSMRDSQVQSHWRGGYVIIYQFTL